MAMSGANMWIVGPAGTGKTHTINTIVSSLVAASKSVAVTAMTGAAASNLDNATTLHRYTRAGTESLKMHLSVFVQSQETLSQSDRDKLCQTDVLIIDEAGMMATDQFSHFDEYFRLIRGKRSKLCGGMQIILVGDIAQIPPVDATAGAGEQRDERIPMTSIFAYPNDALWKVVVLNQFMRSAEDPCLQQICLAVIDARPAIRRMAIELINRKCYNEESVSNPAMIIAAANSRGALVITPTKRQVDFYVSIERAIQASSTSELISLHDPVALYTTESLTREQVAAAGGFAGVKREDEEIRSRGTFQFNLRLFIGQQVQIRMNGRYGTIPYYNGEICIFLGMVEGQEIAILRRLKDSVVLHLEMCEHKTEYEEEVGKIGYLAFAIVPAIATTVHKVQGQTLVGAIFDPTGLKWFRRAIPNITFVSVSRVRKCSDLLLTEPIAEGLMTSAEIQKNLTELWDIDFMQDYPRADEVLLRSFLAE